VLERKRDRGYCSATETPIWHSQNLAVRIDVHERFSTNPYRWMLWVFDHFDLPEPCRILELGCGVGKLWVENADRIRPTWAISVSDFSAAMLAKTKASLADVHAAFEFQQIDVEQIPFGPQTFDAVIANHMLYYARDADRAIAEISRVLKPGGRLYASTNGMKHLKEIDDLIVGFRGGARPIASVITTFNLDTGRDILARHFAHVYADKQANALHITDSEALTAFCLSITRSAIAEQSHSAFATYVAQHVQAHGGTLHIEKDAGLFIALKG
jgi:ubiquinone/menaquinone biosynthesis C-methylase UbiE